MKRISSLVGMLLGLTLLPGSASAVDWTLGAGVGMAPDYEGSNYYEPVPLWNLKASDLYHPDTYVQVVGPRLRSNFIPHENFRLGLAAQYVFERDDVESNRVDNLSSTDDGLLLGVLLGYDFKLQGDRVLGFEFDPRWDVSDDIGGLFTLRAKYSTPLGGGSWRLNAGAEGTYASGDYMDEFFTINAADSARSGLNTFNADSGIKDFGFNAGISYMITPTWSVTGQGSYKRLVEDADDSPVVDDEGNPNQWFGGLLVNVKF